MMNIKVAVIQISSCGAIAPNLLTIKLMARKAAEEGARLLVFPEHFAFIGAHDQDTLAVEEVYNTHDSRIQRFVSELARRLQVWIVGGTIPIRSEQDKRMRSACIVWNSDGEVVARYDKIHLFDMFLAGNGELYQESKWYEPGDQVVVVPTPFGRLGLAIGYDLRFGELFHEMRKQGAELVALPSAFSLATGKAHWHALVQARAIENQLYVLAANQSGVHANGRGTFGHSMVVGPWGNILAEQVGGMGYAIGEVDLLRLQILREDFPVWSHRRLGTHIPLSSDLLASRSSFGLGSSPGVGPLPGVGSSSDLGALPQHSPKPMNPGPGQISPAKKSQSGEGDANE